MAFRGPQLESRLANLKVEEHSKFGHFWKAHDQTNPTGYGRKCNTDTTKKVVCKLLLEGSMYYVVYSSSRLIANVQFKT